MSGANSKRYEAFEDGKVLVKDRVLFGDKHDVKLKHAHDKPELAVGGTVYCRPNKSTKARPGYYFHGKVNTPKYCGGGGDYQPWIHVVHHEDIDGTKLGDLLCNLDGYSNHVLENVWNRYDWCEHSTFGIRDSSGEEDEEEDYDSEKDDYNEDEGFPDKNVYFVPFEGKGKFTLDPSCICGDWKYGVCLVDPKTKLAYAYIFGDALVNDELSGDAPDNLKKTDFNIDPTQLLVSSQAA